MKKILHLLIIVLTACSIVTIANANSQQPITITHQDDYSLTLEFTLPFFEIKKIDTPDGEYQKIQVEGCGTTSETGKPELPIKGALLQIPQSGDISVQVLEYHYETIPDCRIYPVPRLSISENGTTSLEFEKDKDIYNLQGNLARLDNQFFPGNIADISSREILRGTSVARVNISPFQWNLITGELRCYKKIRVQVTFENQIESRKLQDTGRRVQDADSPFNQLKNETILNYTPQPESQILSSPSPQARESSSAPRLKIEIKADGIYRLTFDDLVNAGLNPASIDPATFQVFNLGAEVAINVNSEGDSFASGDYIEFFGKGIDTHITGTNVYWLCWGETSSGKRMKTIDGSVNQGIKQEKFYDVLHLEENLGRSDVVPDAPEKDYFFWRVLTAQSQSYMSEHSVTLPSPFSDQTGAEIWVCFQGKSPGDHFTSVYLNNMKIGDASWNGNIEYIQKMPVTQNLAETNTIRIEAVGNILHQIYLNWIEIHYWRRFEAVNNELAFTVEGNNKRLQMEILNLTQQDIQIYDITNQNDVQIVNNVSFQSGKAVFEDQVNDGKRYYALSADQIKKPAHINLWQSPNLKSTSNGADYLLITAKEFLTAAEPLCQFRESQGLRVKAISVEDILNEFNNGIFHPDIIKDFLKYAYENWERPAPMYVLLAGDASADFRNYQTNKQNHAPVHFSITSTTGLTPDDNWYACVDGDDLLPDMMIGRIPGSSASMITSEINKIIAYEANQTYSPKEILLITDNGEDIDRGINDAIISYLPDDFNVNRVDLWSYVNMEYATQDIISNINKGMLITNFLGHGNITNWTGELVFVSSDPNDPSVASDIDSLNNKDRLTVVFSMNCLSGYFAQPYYYSLAEEFVAAPNKGAVACFAPSGGALPMELGLLDDEIFSTIFKGERNRLGIITTQAKIAMYSDWVSSGSQDLMKMFNLIGDPATQIKLEVSEDARETPTVITQQISEITERTAIGYGNITDLGILSPTHHGIVWSTEHNPTVELNTKTDGGGLSFPSGFTGKMDNLTPDTTYYFRAYATNTAGTGYGEEMAFKTLLLFPKVETHPISDLTTTTITGNGAITDLSPLGVIQHGFVWSTEPEPAVDSESKTEMGAITATSAFSSAITGLTPGTTYYIRAYAVNTEGIAYGDEVEFKTKAVLPKAETKTVSNIKATTANGNGNIMDTGIPNASHHGFVWSTEHTPTVDLITKTDFGVISSICSFTGAITGLTPDTTYYIVAYATNAAGTAYGDEVGFRTSPVLPKAETKPVTNIKATSVTANGNIIEPGIPNPTHHGFVWSSQAKPTIALGTKTDRGTFSATGLFTDDLTGLTSDTTYYVRAYAANTAGTAYGVDVAFKTLPLPILSVTPDFQNVSKRGGTITFQIDNTGGGAMNWAVSEDADWLSVNSLSGSDTATITVTYDTNSGDSRIGILTVTAVDTENSPQKVEIRQATAHDGDINDDGVTDMNDAILGLRIIAGLEVENINAVADINKDEKIGIEEIIYVLEIVSRIRE